MKTIKYMDEDILLEKAIKLLVKGLGPVEAIRFINISKKRRMESVKWHREWQKHLDKEKFFAEVFRNSKP